MIIKSAEIYGIFGPDGVPYVGQRGGVSCRVTTHFNNLRKTKHKNYLLQGAYDFFGKDAFYSEILETLENCTRAELTACEIKWIRHFESLEGTYNLMLPDDSMLGFKHSIETRKKISEIRKSEWANPEIRQKKIEQAKASWLKRGKIIMNEEIREKNKKAAKLSWENSETRAKRILAMNSPEVREKISKASKAAWKNTEYREKWIASSRYGDPEFRAAVRAKQAATVARNKAAKLSAQEEIRVDSDTA